MNTACRSIRRALLGVAPKQTSFQRRGFRGATAGLRERLEKVGGAFLAGYHVAVEHAAPETVGLQLNAIEPELRGFAYEGAAMGLALLDCLTPWRATRISEFLRGTGGAHTYMVHVGIGWAWARMPLGFRSRQKRLDPVLRWLVYDGWGFHEGFFHWRNYIAGQAPPARLAGYERRVFDQGLGRSLWFVNGGNVELMAGTVSDFSPGRRSDLWSGVGLAATYAGIVDEPALRALREEAGEDWVHLAQGAAFAAKARQRAGNLTEHTRLAARVLCGIPAEPAARVTDDALENLPADSDVPAYEIWRRRVQHRLFQEQPMQAA